MSTTPARPARRVLGVLALASIVAAPVAAAVAPPVAQLPALDAARERITRADLESAVRYLASDELRGRFTGDPEAVIAARWLGARLAESGLEPAGDSGTFLQRVPMHRAAPTLVATTTRGEKLTLVHGVDFDRVEAARDVRVERVAIARSRSDAVGRPSSAAALVLPESLLERRALLDALGAGAGSAWGLLISLGPDTPGSERGPAAPRVGGAAPEAPGLRLRGEAKRRMLAGEIAALELAPRVEVEAYNVVGILRGAGAAADEAIVVSAHYDHLGVASGPPGAASEDDRIYNGADDDASGCAVVLELADALAHARPPGRSVVFFLAVGEELGLLGTDWYVDHPAVPLAKTVLNLNFEMLGRPDAQVGGPGKLWLTGDERSNLGSAFRGRGLPILPDPRPEQRFFERSDNIAFVRRGVVGQSLSTYDLHQDYHRVSDHWDTLDYAHMEACARASLDALAIVADSDFRPAWSAGHESGR